MNFSISVVRQKSSPHGTPGNLKTSAGFGCDTLELQWANNKTGVSCILPDTYSATIWFSNTLQRNVIRLEDKHGRKDCLVHNGNFASEVPDEITQVHGCTEVGRGYGEIKAPGTGNTTQFGILHSVETLEALIAHIQDQIGFSPFTVEYSWAEGCEPDDMTDAQA